MGFISAMAKGSSFPGSHQGQALWREIFGTTKEEGRPVPKVRKEWASSVSSKVSYTRLLQAMRSMAPGGWSDDRWEQTKHFVGIAYVGIDRICKMLQQATFKVYKEDRYHPDGKREVTPDDKQERDWCKPYDFVKLLKRPNRLDSFGKWCYRMGQQQRLTGTALDWWVPNEFGVPYEMYCVPTAVAIPQAAINPDFPDGYYRIQPIYPYGPFSSWPTPATAVGAPIPAQFMLRFQYPHPLLRFDGYSPLSGMRYHMDELEMMDRSRAYKMKNSTNPSAVVNLKDVEGGMGMLPEPELNRFHAEWNNEFGGPEKHGGIIVAPPGGEVTLFGTNPVDMDYQSGWDQLTSFILGGGFGITKQAAGMIEDSAYATLFATLKQLHMITLDPDCSDWANELTHHLGHFFGDDLIVEIKPPRIDDHEVAIAKVTAMLQGRLGKINEARAMLDLPVVQEPWGEERLGEIAEDPNAQQPGAAPFGEGETAASGKEAKQAEAEKPAAAAQESERPKRREVAAPEVETSRPKNKQGAGALGPKKSLPFIQGERFTNGYKKKSVPTQSLAACKVFFRSANGRH